MLLNALPQLELYTCKGSAVSWCFLSPEFLDPLRSWVTFHPVPSKTCSNPETCLGFVWRASPKEKKNRFQSIPQIGFLGNPTPLVEKVIKVYQSAKIIQNPSCWSLFFKSSLDTTPSPSASSALKASGSMLSSPLFKPSSCGQPASGNLERERGHPLKLGLRKTQ